MWNDLRKMVVVGVCAGLLALAPRAAAAQASAAISDSPVASPRAALPAAVVPPPDYVIGPQDQLSIIFWRDKDLSVDVVIVRPDGKISLPLLNDVQASGLTPEQLRENVTEAAKRYIEDPNATVVVREINSRKVFITGEIDKPGTYPLAGPTTVLQLIATAGGVREYADRTKIVILRTENGKQIGYRFNYKEVVEQKNMKQNIELRPGDTVIVP